MCIQMPFANKHPIMMYISQLYVKKYCTSAGLSLHYPVKLRFGDFLRLHQNHAKSRTRFFFKKPGFFYWVYNFLGSSSPRYTVYIIFLLHRTSSLWPPCHEGSSSVCLCPGVQPALGSGPMLSRANKQWTRIHVYQLQQPDGKSTLRYGALECIRDAGRYWMCLRASVFFMLKLWHPHCWCVESDLVTC